MRSMMEVDTGRPTTPEGYVKGTDINIKYH